MNPPAGDHSLRIILSLLLAAIVFVAFTPSLNNDFIGWDDTFYILENPYIAPLSFHLIGDIFTNFYFRSYTPLTILGHALLFKGFGLDPRGHHLANLVMHGFNTGILFLVTARMFTVLRRIRGHVSGSSRPSAPAAIIAGIAASLFFAFSPLRLESILAAYSLKDVLSTFLALLSVLFYLWHIETREERPAGRAIFLSFAAFVLALLAKSSVAVLPGILIILEIASEGGGRRLFSRRRLIEKLPFVLVAVAFLLVGFIATGQDRRTESLVIVQVNQWPWLLAVFNVGFYAVRTFWPANTLLVYIAIPGPQMYACVAVAFAASVLSVVLWLKNRRGFAYVWGAYVILLLPFAYFVPVMAQATAARYAYLSTIPFAVAFGFAVAQWSIVVGKGWAKAGGLSCALIVIVILASNSVGQIGRWKDGETIWRHTIAENPPHSFLFEQLAFTKSLKGEHDSARVYYERAILLDSNAVALKCNLAATLIVLHDTVAAAAILAEPRIQLSREVIRYVTLGALRLEEGKYAQAIVAFRQGLESNPDSFRAYFGMACAFTRMARYAEALSAVDNSLRLNPNLRDGYYLKGVLLDKNPQWRVQAREMYRTSARLGFSEAQRHLLEIGDVW